MSVGQVRATRRKMRVMWANKLQRKPRLFKGHTSKAGSKR